VFRTFRFRTIRCLPLRFLFSLLLLAAVTAAVADENATVYCSPPKQTKAERDARMAWWRQAKFGMFIHFGLFSEAGGYWQGKPVGNMGEWMMKIARIPVADYATLATRFNPVKFDADQWVALAKSAGMKYIVITAKHHEGFAMYHTKLDRFNVVDATPFKRDVIKEMSEACARQGIKFGVYYSQDQDWHHAGGGMAGAAIWDPAQAGDKTQYVRNVDVPQVKELLSNYGPIAEFWWDCYGLNKQQARILLPLLAMQPNMLVNDRLGGDVRGDFGTPEGHIPERVEHGDWETCMTFNDTWGYKKDEHHWKSAATLIHQLVDIVSKNGNYLLNVGPDGEGQIPAASVERLRTVGKWVAANGESIYGAQPTIFGEELGRPSPTLKDARGNPVFVPAWQWRCTVKPAPAGSSQGGKIFIHLFDWPGKAFTLAHLKDRVTKAYLLADPQRTLLPVRQDETTLTIGNLPDAAPDPVDTVLCLETDQALKGQP
jgi:alpha-L-fucosidase